MADAGLRHGQRMLINVILGGKTVLDRGVPRVEGGYLAKMDTADLERKDSVIDNEVEHTEVTEYWLAGELVHRSVAMRLKTPMFAKALAGAFT